LRPPRSSPSPFLLTAITAGLGLHAGCSSEPPDEVLDRVFDVCEPTVLFATGATDAEQASIDDAIALWRARGIGELGRDEVEGAARLEVRFEPAGRMFRGLYDDEGGVVYINTRLAAVDRPVVIAHELGHAFGLWHVESEERVSVMNPGNLHVTPTEADAAEVIELWGRCGGASPQSGPIAH
jgi:hypothetical protein